MVLPINMIGSASSQFISIVFPALLTNKLFVTDTKPKKTSYWVHWRNCNLVSIFWNVQVWIIQLELIIYCITKIFGFRHIYFQSCYQFYFPFPLILRASWFICVIETIIVQCSNCIQLKTTIFAKNVTHSLN